MTFIGLVEGTKGYIFMRSPNNIVFTAIQALFDETLFPKCPNMRCLGYTPVGLPPDDLQGEHNGPLDNENEDYGGGSLPPLPPIPYHPVAQQGPSAARQQPPPPSTVTSGRGSPLQSYRDDDDDALSYQTRSPSPPVSPEPTPPVTPPQRFVDYWDYDFDYVDPDTGENLEVPRRVPRPFPTPKGPEQKYRPMQYTKTGVFFVLEQGMRISVPLLHCQRVFPHLLLLGHYRMCLHKHLVIRALHQGAQEGLDDLLPDLIMFMEISLL
jgi:hypothetical protein